MSVSFVHIYFFIYLHIYIVIGDAQTGNNWGYRRFCTINEARKCVEQTADGRLYMQCELSVVKQRHAYNCNANHHLMPFVKPVCS